MNKKGDFGWEEISKIILVLVAILILLGIAYLLRDKIMDLVDKLKNILRFGV